MAFPIEVEANSNGIFLTCQKPNEFKKLKISQIPNFTENESVEITRELIKNIPDHIVVNLNMDPTSNIWWLCHNATRLFCIGKFDKLKKKIPKIESFFLFSERIYEK